MIGVIARRAEFPAVEEFFQMFKTPWEFFEPGRTYDVVIITTEEVPVMDAKVLLVYGSAPRSCDARLKLSTHSRVQPARVSCEDVELPLYRGALGLSGAGARMLGILSSAEHAGIKCGSARQVVYRFGFDLFQEIAALLEQGQPAENAGTPTLEIHIQLLRNCILDAGVSIMEIPPAPAGQDFIVSLTHDIDFVGIRKHFFDHTMLGFFHRATAGTLRDLIRGKISLARALKIWLAVLKLPFVYLHLAKDFWIPFEWYLEVEKNLPATYYLIPFKHQAGERVASRHADRRAAPYDITDLPEWTAALLKAGCEIGVHGIDSWHSVEEGREELRRITQATNNNTGTGIRMHWLLRDEHTNRVLEQAGYTYDSTTGYNETVGYFSGTTQVYRPLDARTLLELPMHIQDGALFYANRLNLSDAEAWNRCQPLLQNARRFGGVLTLLWHDRSHGPERFWGGFYMRMVRELKTQKVWFATARQAVDWFQTRREATFEQNQTGLRVKLPLSSRKPMRPLALRVHRACPSDRKTTDISWTGDTDMELNNLTQTSDSQDSTVPAMLVQA
jgi:hypothetical protein